MAILGSFLWESLSEVDSVSGREILSFWLKGAQPSAESKLDHEKNISDCMTVLPKLGVGLDVNVRFTGYGGLIGGWGHYRLLSASFFCFDKNSFFVLTLGFC